MTRIERRAFAVFLIGLAAIVAPICAGAAFGTKSAPIKCTVDAIEERKAARDPTATIVLAARVCPRGVRVLNGTALDLYFDN